MILYMKLNIKILMIAIIITFSGCSSFVQQENNSDLDSADIMMAIHCLEMPMPGCEEYENIDISDDDIINACKYMPNMKICGTISTQKENDESINENKYENIKFAKKSQILNLENNDKINLTIDIVKKNIKGNIIKMFGYNGQIPGPLIHVKQNSTIYVNVTNNLDTETTIHWHGLRLNNKFDGVPDMTMKTQKPGDSFEYQLNFIDEGIYWYHPHVREDYQQEMGLYGNMLVDSKYSDYYNQVNYEIPLILDDVLIQGNEMAPFFDGHITHSLMGRFGNVMLINGDDDYNITLEKGSVVRFYLTNVANTRLFNFSISGVKMKIVGSDIGSYE